MPRAVGALTVLVALAPCDALRAVLAPTRGVLRATPAVALRTGVISAADEAVPARWRRVDRNAGGKAAVDWRELSKYPLATLGQYALIAGLFRAVDTLVKIPAPLVPPLFFALSLKSRVFSFLPAKRPNRTQGGEPTPANIKRPSWTPPGIAFPIIWITISVLRAASSFLIWRATGRALFSAPLLALVAHLCVGDTWNCVTNVERRLGTSAVGVLLVWASVVNAVAKYYAVLPKAGLILLPSACWISVATILTWTIWKINEPRQPLLPRAGDGKASGLIVPLSQLDL